MKNQRTLGKASEDTHIDTDVRKQKSCIPPVMGVEDVEASSKELSGRVNKAKVDY